MAQIQFQPNIKLDLQDIVNLVSQLDNNDLIKFKTQIDTLWSQRSNEKISDEELKLLKEVETQISTKDQKRYALLVEKSDCGELTEKERKEALSLFDKLEGDFLRRLKAAEKLASIRKVDFAVLAKDFGLLNPTNV